VHGIEQPLQASTQMYVIAAAQFQSVSYSSTKEKFYSPHSSTKEKFYSPQGKLYTLLSFCPWLRLACLATTHKGQSTVMQVLGKKVGKALAKVKAALSAMTPAEIAAFERDGCAEVVGERLDADDIRVRRALLP